MSTLPADFLKTMGQILPSSELSDFIASLELEQRYSIRLNPNKQTLTPKGVQISWTDQGFYLDEKPSFTLDPAFHGGAYYVQESSSMFIEYLIKQCFEPNKSLLALDLCAAPGGKTTLLSSLVGSRGLVHANEVIRSRAQILADNVKKWGLANVVVTSNDPSHFESVKHFYDLIVVDAPCSGEGMFRKDADARGQWSEGNVVLCAERQRRILSDIWQCLKPGGILIYSTCTFNTKENEENIKWLKENFDTEGLEIDCPEQWQIVKTEVEGTPCFRFYPHLQKGEGFFCAVVIKGEDKVRTKLAKARKTIFSELSSAEKKELSKWVNQADTLKFAKAADNIYCYHNDSYKASKDICERFSPVYSGVEMGQLFSGKLKPSHSLALYYDLDVNNLKTADLTLEDARNYLRRNELPASLFHQGINLVCHNNLGIGWAKGIQNRVNNMYPTNLRILNL